MLTNASTPKEETLLSGVLAGLVWILRKVQPVVNTILIDTIAHVALIFTFSNVFAWTFGMALIPGFLAGTIGHFLLWQNSPIALLKGLLHYWTSANEPVKQFVRGTIFTLQVAGLVYLSALCMFQAPLAPFVFLGSYYLADPLADFVRPWATTAINLFFDFASSLLVGREYKGFDETMSDSARLSARNLEEGAAEIAQNPEAQKASASVFSVVNGAVSGLFFSAFAGLHHDDKAEASKQVLTPR